MSFKPLHQIDDGAVTRLSFVPISDGTLVQKCTTQELISTGLGTGSDLEYGSNNLLAIKNGAIDSSKLSTGAITADKIKDGEIDLSKIKTEGVGSVPINALKRKTLCLHVGNYYRNGNKILSNDSYNYDDFLNRYNARTEEVIDQSDTDNLNHVWNGTYADSSEVHIVESFSTISSAARFAVHNYGPNLNVIFLIHGHVSAFGAYDLDLNKRISEVSAWQNFNNIAIISGSPPDHDSTNSHIMNFMDDAKTLARVDWDQDEKNSASALERELAFSFDGPNVMFSGIHFVLSSTANFPNVSNKFRGGSHQINGAKITSLGDIDHLTSYFIERSSVMQFGSSDYENICNEFRFREDGTLFKISDRSTIYYATDSINNDILISAYSNGAEIVFGHLIQGSTLDIGKNNTEVYIKNVDNLSTSIEPIILENGRNTFLTEFSSDYYLSGGTDFFKQVSSDLDQMYENGMGNMSGPSNRKNYNSEAAQTNSLLSRHNSSSYKSSKTSLNASRLAGETNFKSAPSTRTSNPYSDQ